MKFKKIIALFLVVSMLLPLASCRNTDDNDSVTSDTSETTGETAPTEESETTSGLPEKNFDGRDFHFYVMGKERNANNYSVEIYSSEQIGEIVNDSVYNRNMALSERYNFSISETPSGVGEDLASNISKLVQSGDDTYQVAMLNLVDSTTLISKNSLCDLNKVDYLDLSQSWWDGTIADDLTIGGKLYSAMGDINIMDNNATWAVFFNKKLMNSHGYEMPYQTVKDGKWTYDAYYDLSSAVANDLDGNGQMDDNDLWGTVGAAENTAFMFFSSGEKFIDKDENDMPLIKTPTDRVYSVIDKIMMIQQDSQSTLLVENAKGSYGNVWSDLIRANFKNDLALFYVAGMLTYTLMREMESEYGLLPMPKLDEAQQNYCTTLNQNNCSAVTIPLSNKAVSDTGFVLEAMAFESAKTLTPAYYEVALQRKYMSDEESRDMLSIILANRTVDQSIVYNWGGIGSTLSSMTTSGDTNFASKFTAIERLMQKSMENFVSNIES